MKNYPLIHALGVKIYDQGNAYVSAYVTAADLEGALAKASVVYGNVEFDWWAEEPRNPKDDQWQHTHTACLVCVQPYARADTAEGLLQELVDAELWEGPINDIKERARKILGR